MHGCLDIELKRAVCAGRCMTERQVKGTRQEVAHDGAAPCQQAEKAQQARADHHAHRKQHDDHRSLRMRHRLISVGSAQSCGECGVASEEPLQCTDTARGLRCPRWPAAANAGIL